MALINCPDCNGKASDKAEACPHCGSSLASNPLRMLCPECDFMIQGNPSACPTCGFPLGKSAPHEINLPGGGLVSIPSDDQPIVMHGTHTKNETPPPPPSNTLPPLGDASPPPPPTGDVISPIQMASMPTGQDYSQNPPPPAMEPPPPTVANPPAPPSVAPTSISASPMDAPVPTDFYNQFSSVTPQPVANIMLCLNNQVTGPHAMEEIQYWLQAGTLSSDTPCMNQGDPQWSKVADLFGVPIPQQNSTFPGPFSSQSNPNIANAESNPETKPIALTIIGIFLSIFAVLILISTVTNTFTTHFNMVERSEIRSVSSGAPQKLELTDYIELIIIFSFGTALAYGQYKNGRDLLSVRPEEKSRKSALYVCIFWTCAFLYIAAYGAFVGERASALYITIYLILPIPFITSITFLSRANVKNFCQSQK